MREVVLSDSAIRRADFLCYQLIQWYEEGVDENPQRQAVNNLVFRNASRMLKKLAANVRPEYTLLLEVGFEPVPAFSFEEINRKIVFSDGKTLESHSFLCLDEGYAERYNETYSRSEDSEVFLGDSELYVATSALAKTLYENGTLKIISQDNAGAIKMQPPG